MVIVRLWTKSDNPHPASYKHTRLIATETAEQFYEISTGNNSETAA
jgi:hypothetical protein